MSFPVLRSGSVAMHPTTISKEYVTDIVQHVDDSEQRWNARGPLTSFSLVFTGINSYDVDALRAFFLSKKGRFVDASLSNTFDIVDAAIPGSPYHYCYFDQDDLSVTCVGAGNRYNVTLKIGQARI